MEGFESSHSFGRFETSMSKKHGTVCASLIVGRQLGSANQARLAHFSAKQNSAPALKQDGSENPDDWVENYEYILQGLLATIDDLDDKNRKDTGVVLSMSTVAITQMVPEAFGNRMSKFRLRSLTTQDHL